MKRTGAGIVLCILLLLFLTVSVSFCLAASQTKATAPLENNNPADTVSAFFTAVEQQDYDLYTDYLHECKSLGLENEPEDEIERILWNEFRSSFSHEIKGDVRVEYDRAYVDVQLTGLSFPKASDEVKKKTKALISEKMNNPSVDDKIFDDNGEYLEEFVMEQYNKAVEEFAESGGNYLSSAEITVELVYIQGKWRIVVTDELAEALVGNIFM